MVRGRQGTARVPASEGEEPAKENNGAVWPSLAHSRATERRSTRSDCSREGKWIVRLASGRQSETGRRPAAAQRAAKATRKQRSKEGKERRRQSRARPSRTRTRLAPCARLLACLWSHSFALATLLAVSCRLDGKLGLHVSCERNASVARRRQAVWQPRTVRRAKKSVPARTCCSSGERRAEEGRRRRSPRLALAGQITTTVLRFSACSYLADDRLLNGLARCRPTTVP